MNQRILKEIEKTKKKPLDGVTVVVDPNNLRYFHIIIKGAEGTCYEGGNFKLELFLTADYPMQVFLMSILFRLFFLLFYQYNC